MPNHVSNRVSFDDPEESIDAILTLMKTNESEFDFNVLIPYPSRFAELDRAARQAEDAGVPWHERPKDGFNSGGYEWCIEHWGTKWDAYDIGIDYDAIFFCTAWSTPLPIWVALSMRFPGQRIVVEYADEDRGRNCGRIVLHDGRVIANEDERDLRDPELFARAIIAEQKAANMGNRLNAIREGSRDSRTLAGYVRLKLGKYIIVNGD